MMDVKKSPTAVSPTLSVVSLHPILEEMQAHGHSREALAAKLMLPVTALDEAAVHLPANAVYAFLAWSTGKLSNHELCARAGQRMAQGGWVLTAPIFQASRTVGEFLRRFGIAVEDRGASATYRLEVEGRQAYWRLTRPKGTTRNARFADAIAVGFFVEILKQATRDKNFQQECTAVTSDGSLVPQDVLPAENVIEGAKGLTLHFPSARLDLELPDVSPRRNLPAAQFPRIGDRALSSSVRQVLAHNISNPEFGIDDIAAATGLPKWKLQRNLRVENTSVADLRNDVRMSQAVELLRSTDRGIKEIAAQLGYISSSNFSRAFRTHTGRSPSEFRENRSGKVHRP